LYTSAIFINETGNYDVNFTIQSERNSQFDLVLNGTPVTTRPFASPGSVSAQIIIMVPVASPIFPANLLIRNISGNTVNLVGNTDATITVEKLS
jgi:hypothetical protein